MTDQQFDGDGNRVKSVQRRFDEQTSQWVTEVVTYYVNSTVLGGQLLTELTAQGTKQRTLVYAGKAVLALQNVAPNSSQSVTWEHRDASGASLRMTDASGQGTAQAAEMDPMGVNAGLFKPFTWTVPDKTGQLVPYPGSADMITNPGGGCVADGVPIPCEMLNQNNSRQCEDNDCGPRVGKDGKLTQPFQSFPDGWGGFLPPGAVYRGNGRYLVPGDPDELNEGGPRLRFNHASGLPQNSAQQTQTTNLYRVGQ